MKVFGAKNADQAEDLETALVLGVTFVMVSLVTWVALRLVRKRP